MANIAKDRNPMIKLKVDEPEKPDPLTIEPLPESVMFEKKKPKKSVKFEGDSKEVNDQVEIKIKDQSEIPVEVPLKKAKAKKPRKKRQLSAEHLEKLRLGRLKGLETRRRRAAERKARAQAIADEKQAQYDAKVKKKVESEHQRTLKLAKKLQNSQVRKEYQKKAVKKADPADPDAGFKQFFNYMSRWEAIKVKQYQERQKAKAAAKPKPKAKAAPQKKSSFNSFYQTRAPRKRLINKQNSGNSANPYLSFYS